jgi:hypothetical protein
MQRWLGREATAELQRLLQDRPHADYTPYPLPPPPAVSRIRMPMGTCRGRGGESRRQGAAVPPPASKDLHPPRGALSAAALRRDPGGASLRPQSKDIISAEQKPRALNGGRPSTWATPVHQRPELKGVDAAPSASAPYIHSDRASHPFAFASLRAVIRLREGTLRQASALTGTARPRILGCEHSARGARRAGLRGGPRPSTRRT